jgi:hypothetical protein
LSILLDYDWEIRPRYRGDVARILHRALTTNDGNLIEGSKDPYKDVGTNLMVLSM